MNASPAEATASLVSAQRFEQLVRASMGQMPSPPRFDFTVETLDFGSARLRLRFDANQLRPGGTIAGPVMFTLADTAMYALVMSVAGFQPLAVTTDLNIRFLSKPEPVDLIAEGSVLKAGRRLVSCEVRMRSQGRSQPVAHATGTYALPSAAKPADDSNRKTTVDQPTS